MLHIGEKNELAPSRFTRNQELFETHDPTGLADVQATRNKGNPDTQMYVYVHNNANGIGGYTGHH